MTRLIIGCDPGGTTGLARLDLDRGSWDLLQVTPACVPEVVAALVPRGGLVALAVEKFVVGPRAGRLSTPKAGETTRHLVAILSEFGASLGGIVHLRSAHDVKLWATNTRLDAAGIRLAGMPHAHDAARHALFAAVQSGLLPDPLSKAWRLPP